MPYFEGDLRAPDGARFAIIASRWNPRITDTLVAGARKTFAEHGVAEDAIDVVRVPGAWELPVAAARLAKAGRHAAIVALGCVIRGDTRHYEQVADGCSDPVHARLQPIARQHLVLVEVGREHVRADVRRVDLGRQPEELVELIERDVGPDRGLQRIDQRRQARQEDLRVGLLTQ